MPSIKDVIQAQYPTLDDMPFCAALRDGRFGRTEILRSEIVELYRALKTRHTIQDLYKEKLNSAVETGLVTPTDVDVMEEVIDDEGETDEHIDHLDMRFKLFTGTNVSRAATLNFHQGLETINDDWMQICRDSDLLSMMAFTAAIEDWYAPLSGFFEEQYRKRGFTEDELELFIAHQSADVEHSTAQFDILERHADKMDPVKIGEAVRRTFMTSTAYDRTKLELAEADIELDSLITV